MNADNPVAQTVLDFWFEEATPRQWWAKSEAFDRLIESRFAALLAAAARCELYAWRSTPRGRLAEIIVLEIFILAWIKLGWTEHRPATFLILPYAAWVGFATCLNATLAWLN